MRDWTSFNLQVVRGDAGGQVLWQPRIIAWYHDRQFQRVPLPAPYTGLSLPDLYRALDCSNRIYDFFLCFVPHEDPRVRQTNRLLPDGNREIRWETPVGTQRALYRISAENPFEEPVIWPISDEADMRVALWREAHRTWSWDQARYEELCHEWHGLGAPSMFILRTTMQYLFVTEMGVEATIYALMDYPDLCAAFFDALNHNQQQLLDLIIASPIEFVNYGDNVHGGCTPPDLFEKYMLPVYQERYEKLHTAGKFVTAHWDGDCRMLLPLAQATGLDGLEALTPVPQGDVTLDEIKAGLGDDMWLVDGIPAVYFDHTYSVETLLDHTRRCLELFAPRLILGISDEISSQGDIERVRLVGALVDEYNNSLS